MDRRFLVATLGLLGPLLGLWIAVAPFSRPLPGGAPYGLTETPEVQCRSPLSGSFAEDRPVSQVFTTPGSQVGDPTVDVSVDCTARARFRLVLGMTLLLATATAARRLRRVSPV